MDLDHWKQLDSLLQSVLERPLEERDAFLRHACAGDEPLERRIRALLVAQDDRAPAMPDIPTSKEAGVDQFLLQGWAAVFAPKGTPKPIVAKLSDALRAAVSDPAVRKRIEEVGALPATGDAATPDYLSRMLKSDIERWSVVIKAVGVSEPAPN